jgi:hypothetical protein
MQSVRKYLAARPNLYLQTEAAIIDQDPSEPDASQPLQFPSATTAAENLVCHAPNPFWRFLFRRIFGIPIA